MTAIKWTEKYRPRRLKEVLGNGKAVSELEAWARAWERGVPDKRAVVLYGPAGVGKTSAALALAEEMGWDQIEMNASDSRTAAAISKVAGAAARMMTFSGKKRLVILDEADNLYGSADRGGSAAMLRLVREADQPVVLIANDYYGLSKLLREGTLGIQFRRITKSTVLSALREICRAEGAACTPELIAEIADMANGDLRSAINDLQAALEGSREVGEVATAVRDAKASIFDGVAKILRGSSLGEAVQIAWSLDESPEDLVHWIDENLPLVYGTGDLAAGYERLSRADVFLGRVRRRQNYGLWRYASFMMTGGVQAARTEKKGGVHTLPASRLLAEDGPDEGGEAGPGVGGGKDRPTLPHQLPDGEGRDDGALRPPPERPRDGAEGGCPPRLHRRGDRPPPGDEADDQEGPEDPRGRPGASRGGEGIGDRGRMGRRQKAGEGRKEGAAKGG